MVRSYGRSFNGFAAKLTISERDKLIGEFLNNRIKLTIKEHEVIKADCFGDAYVCVVYR